MNTILSGVKMPIDQEKEQSETFKPTNQKNIQWTQE